MATIGSEKEASGRGGGLRVADLPIDRIFHEVVDLANPGGMITPVVIPFPSNAGAVISRITRVDTHPSASLRVRVNGRIVVVIESSGTSWHRAGSVHEFSPPLLVRPGDTLELEHGDASSGSTVTRSFVLSGYKIYDLDL